jgi:hypothetical protein
VHNGLACVVGFSQAQILGRLLPGSWPNNEEKQGRGSKPTMVAVAAGFRWLPATRWAAAVARVSRWCMEPVWGRWGGVAHRR